MKQWEYLIEELIYQSAGQLRNSLNDRGKEGWELITLTHGATSVGEYGISRSVSCVFMREVRSPALLSD